MRRFKIGALTAKYGDGLVLLAFNMGAECASLRADVVAASALRGELRNPKVGGVYHIGAAFSGSPTNECNVVLPLAGAGMDT